jgi:MFS family permease
VRRVPGWVLDFFPAALADFTFHVDFFVLQGVLDERLQSRGQASSFALALFSVSQTLVYIPGTPLFGSVSDRLGRRLCAGAGSALFALVPLAFLLEPEDGWFYAAMAVLGLAGALFWPSVQARLGERTEREGLGAAFFRFNLGWTVGKAAGFEVAGRVLKSHHPSWGLVISSLASVVALVLVALDTAPARSGDAPAAREAGIPVLPQSEKRGFLIAGLATLVTAWGAQRTLFALIPDLGRAIALDKLEQSRILTFLVLSQSAAFALMTRPARWAYRPRLLLALAPLAAAGAVGVFFSLGFRSLLAPALLIGLVSGCGYTESIFYGTDYDERRGLRMGVNEAAIGLGGLLPLVGGELAQRSGEVRVPYLVVAWAALVAAFVAATAISRARRPASS